jgi:hypothetical protein
MTVSTTTRKAGPFIGNGVTTVFPFNFKVFAKSDLQVILTDAAGAETVLDLDADYSVALNADQDNTPGGTVTYSYGGIALPSTQKLTILSDVPLLQPTDIQNRGGFYPSVIEDALDRVTILAQQAEELLGRAIRFAVSDGATNAELPTAAARAGKAIVFDENGNIAVSDAGWQVEVTHGNVIRTTHVKGVGFVAGGTTLFLPSDGFIKENVHILFAGTGYGVELQQTAFSLNGTTITLVNPIPADVEQIETWYIQPLAVGSINDGVVTDAKVASSAAIDAAKLMFVQAGANAVARTVRDKLREMPLSPEDFVAVSDPDYTAAFQRVAARINAMGGGRVRLVSGKDYPVLQDGGTHFDSMMLFTSCYGVTIEGNGARIVTGSVTMTQYLIEFNACVGARIENLRLKSNYQVLTSVAGIYWIRSRWGARNIVLENVDMEYGCVGFVAQGAYSSDGVDTDRVRNIVLDNVSSLGTYYPALFQSAGDNVRGKIITRNAGRSYFVFNAHDHDMRVDSQQGGPFSDVLIKCYGSTDFLSKTQNIKLVYKSDGRYPGSGMQSANEAMIAMDFQLQPTNPAPVVFTNIAIQFDVSASSTDVNQNLFIIRKYDSDGNPDATARGHTLVGLDLRGVGLSLQNLNAAALNLFGRSGDSWVGEYIYDVYVHDMLLNNAATQNSLVLNCDGLQSTWKVERVRATGDLALTNPTGKDLVIDESVFDNYASRSRIPQKYTPAWTTSGTAPTLGNAIFEASYVVRGRLCAVDIYLQIGSTTNVGTGQWQFSLPFASTTETISPPGVAGAKTGAVFRPGWCLNTAGTSTVIAQIGDSQANFVTNTVPSAWTTGDYVRLHLEYVIGYT